MAIEEIGGACKTDGMNVFDVAALSVVLLPKWTPDFVVRPRQAHVYHSSLILAGDFFTGPKGQQLFHNVPRHDDLVRGVEVWLGYSFSASGHYGIFFDLSEDWDAEVHIRPNGNTCSAFVVTGTNSSKPSILDLEIMKRQAWTSVAVTEELQRELRMLKDHPSRRLARFNFIFGDV